MKKRYESDLLPKQYADARIGLATQLRQARIAKHMTQQAVAELAGTQRSNISRMESGKRCAENLLAVDEKRSLMLEPTPQMC